MAEIPTQLTTPDGFSLSATHSTPGGAARGVVLVLGATAVRQRFYARFAELLVKEGLEVVTVDYRGIGASRPESLKSFDCTYRHWFDFDVPTAFEFAKSRGPVVVVGHSFGWLAFGQLPSPNEALGLFNDWKRWSQLPRYFFDDPALDMKGLFSRVTVPVLGLTSRDDPWAPPKSQESFLSHYTRAQLTLETIEPRDWGLKSVGHMGPFQRAGLPKLFPRLLRFINERLAEHHGSRAA